MSETLFRICAATPWLIALCVFDIRQRRLPNAGTMGGALAFLVYAAGVGGLPLFVRELSAGALAALFLILPFILHAAGGGDVKMLFACGILVGLKQIVPLLFFVSVSGLIVAVAMGIFGRVDVSRLRHYARCLFDWRYDRKAGKAKLPPPTAERCRVPFGVAIALGTWLTFAWQLWGGRS